MLYRYRSNQANYQLNSPGSKVIDRLCLPMSFRGILFDTILNTIIGSKKYIVRSESAVLKKEAGCTTEITTH